MCSWWGITHPTITRRKKTTKKRRLNLSSSPADCFYLLLHPVFSVFILEYWWWGDYGPTEAEFLDVIGTKRLKSFPPCFSQSPILTNLHPSPLEQKWFEIVCNVNIVYCIWKPQVWELCPETSTKLQNCMFMNSASGDKAHKAYCPTGVGNRCWLFSLPFCKLISSI